MRITGGVFKGRKITSPPEGIPGVRPSKDMLREAVFSVLKGYLSFEGLEVLDLYSGSGSYGFEAFSRGATYVEFVEKNRSCLKVVNKTAHDLGISDKVLVISSEVSSYLTAQEKKFDLVFADPPYRTVTLSWLGDLICRSGILKKNGVLLYECDSDSLEDEIRLTTDLEKKGLVFKASKRYSKSGIMVLINEK